MALVVSFVLLITASKFFVQANNTAQTPPFSQNWTTTTLITANDNWSGVPGIEGFLGQDITTSTGTDPQTLLGVSSVANDLDVIANQTNPDTLANGGVAEFDGIANPTIALNGSGTADAPYILIHLNTTGQSSINVAYNLRDLDGSADNATMQVALQFRVGASGNFTNVPAGYVADATTGGSATQVTPVSVTLPAAAENQALIQVRIMTTNAVGNDEWVGIDDINITGMGGGSTNPSGVGAATPSSVVQGGSTLLTVTVSPGTNPASTGLAVTGDLTPIGGSATQQFFDNATNGDVTSGDNIFSFQATVAPATVIGPKSLPITITDAQMRMGSTSISLTVTSATPLRIHDIQGAGHVSPVVGSAVSNIPGIVTALRSNGFYIQDPMPDANDATSEAVFVFTSTAPPPAAALGNLVSVGGTVAEFGSGTNLTNTEITSPTVVVTSTGNPLPAPTVIGTGGRIPPTTIIDDDSPGGVVGTGTPFDPANDGIDFYESLEGMRVQINNAVAVGPTSDNNEIPVLGDNGVNASIRTARGGIVIRATDFNPERIFVDDTLLAGSIPQVNVADTFSAPIVGIMDYSAGNFRVLTTSALTAVSGGLLPEVTIPQGTNDLAIATFNVENLDPGDPASKFNTLASLIVNNLKSPDIICVEEIQDNNGPTNDGTVDATTTFNMLISAIQSAGGPPYQFRQINPGNNTDGGEGGGNIRQGFLFRTDRGIGFIDRPGGGTSTSTTVVNSVDGPILSASPGRIDPTNTAFNSSRKPLVGEFGFKGQRFFIIGNHFNSKGGDDPLFGRNQPPTRSSEVQRNQQAQIVNNFVDSILALNANANIVVLGDINDFEFSTTVDTLKGGVLHPLIESLPQNERYSYNFEGNAQTLDHILVSNNLFTNIPFVYDVVHVNSEFAVQSSDHDPSVVRFTFAPSAARIDDFQAESYGGQVLLQWKTGEEVDNLGFNLYREENGKRTRLNPQILAGSALVAGPGIEMKAGRSYSWWDDSRQNPRYWLEELGIDGNSVWHGPVTIKYENGRKQSAIKERQAVMLSMLGREQIQESSTRPVESKADSVQLAAAQFQSNVNLAAQPAVKISVNHEGWYRVTQPELVRAGLDPKVNPRMLQLYVDGREQPISLTGKNSTDFGSSDAMEFYGIGLDTASTNSRVYWLIAGTQPGQRIQQVKSTTAPASASSFAYTVERKDRAIYFSGLRNGDKENFFGAVVTGTPVDQALTLQHLDARAAQATLEVALQGVTLSAHRVKVLLNGSEVGEAVFDGQSLYIAKLPVSQGLLREGENIVRLAAQGTESNISLVDYIRLTYQHSFIADNNALRFTAAGKQQVTIDGFTGNTIRVFDVTSPDAVQEVIGVVKPQKNGFAVTVVVPGNDSRTLLAITNDRTQSPSSVSANSPSNWRQVNQSADFVIITHHSLLASAKQLQTYRENQGFRGVLADVEDLYDEFSFGNKSPYAVRDFLAYAKTSWQRAPRFVLLIGDASLDPKNYLGGGDFDLVPTKLLDTEYMEAASDDWFTDFKATGFAELSVGRLPVRGTDEAARMIAKIINYESTSNSDGALIVSDTNSGFNFEEAGDQLKALVPDNIKVEQINLGQLGTAAAKKALLVGINRGQRVVNYFGHGSTTLWHGNLLTSAEARGLTNGNRLPLFVVMTCLNGYFQEASLDSLAESLMKAEQGGAIAVWASSGMTLPSGQFSMNQELYKQIFDASQSQRGLLGEVTLKAKSVTFDGDVRRTWILFGDPMTRLK